MNQQQTAFQTDWLKSHCPYKMVYWNQWDYTPLLHISYRRRPGKTKDKDTISDCFMMADTETSKKTNGTPNNHIVCWTVSIRAYGLNLVTLWGHRPTEFVDCMIEVMEHVRGDQIYVYFHNLSYDWVFLRRYLINEFGEPDSQLNTKSHYPINIHFRCGLVLKDSLILAQRTLEKWAKDLNVEHQKAVGNWNYNKLRTQNEEFTPEELEYIEHDTLSGVECLNAYANAIHKEAWSLPYTATGVIREELYNIGKDNNARDWFKASSMDYNQYIKATQIYHGGFTHANRHEIGYINEAKGYDFASSYPFCLLNYEYPYGKWVPLNSNVDLHYILDQSRFHCFMFKLIMIKPQLKSADIPMPALQYSKCVKMINPVTDNGRILEAEYVEIYLNEIDAVVIASQYSFKAHLCVEVEYCSKSYLPRWITDYIYDLFRQKTVLKGGDPVLYALAKARINSVYGLFVQRSIRDEITEQYATGIYETAEQDPRELYEKYLKSPKTILPYQIGCWVTSYAFLNLFRLGSCVASDGQWLYSDTDSCYATKWDEGKVSLYNDRVKESLTGRGYGAIIHNGREYWLGIAETNGDEDIYTEFTSLGAKRYCGRQKEDGKLHITVAGVPKKGAECLHDDIRNFRMGTVFDGVTTGKLTHTYFYVDHEYIDKEGNETADSVDLSPCDYLLDQTEIYDIEDIFTENIEIRILDIN